MFVPRQSDVVYMEKHLLMQIKKILLAASLSFVSMGAVAESYQADINLKYERTSFDSFRGFSYPSLSRYTLDAKYHFNDVDTSGKPLAEAAFLQRSNNAFIFSSDLEQEIVQKKIGAEFYVNHFYIAPAYVSTKFEELGPFDNVTVNTLELGLGLAGDGWRVFTTIPEENYLTNLEAKYVADFGDGFFNLEASYEKADTEFDFDASDLTIISADYYTSNTFSVGVVREKRNDANLGFRVNKFFNEHFKVGASYLNADRLTRWSLDFSIRF